MTVGKNRSDRRVTAQEPIRNEQNTRNTPMNIKTIAPLLLTTLVLNTYAEDSEELLIIEDEETLIMETDHHDSETIVLEESGEVR